MINKIHLSKTIDSENYNQLMHADVIVSGKELSPYFVPKSIVATCAEREFCKQKICSLLEEAELDLTPYLTSSFLIELIRTPESSFQEVLKKALGINKKCDVAIKRTQTMPVENIIMIPALSERSFTNSETSYVVRQGYSLVPDVRCNQVYEAELKSISDPETNIATHIITSLTPKKAKLDFTSHDLESLNLFRPKTLSEFDIWIRLKEIYEIYSTYVTHIYNRFHLHMGIDLVFHSPLHFNFGNEYIHKGWGEILLLGDTQCGKGATAEALARYYNVGEVVSGENATFVGLVGGIQSATTASSSKNGILTWGRVVLNNGGLVIIDEISGLALTGILAKMSRIRSEGISELDKAGIHTSAEACTRLIWISNPKGGKSLRDYKHGVLALAELIGANEDISRFDFVVTATQGEVSSDLINCAHNPPEFDLENLKSLDRLLLSWVWSLKPNRIVFSKEAIAKVYELSNRIPRKYSATIPLVQSETFRIKLSKVAVMIAARLFLSDPPYKELYIPESVVEAALQFLEQVYALPGLAYNYYSEELESVSHLSEDVELYLSTLDKAVVDFLFTTKYFSMKAFCSGVSMDKFTAEELIQTLVKNHIVIKYFTAYQSSVYGRR